MRIRVLTATTWSAGSSAQEVTHPENHSSLMLPHHLSTKMTDISARRSNLDGMQVALVRFPWESASYFDTEPDGKREEEENQCQDEDHEQPLKHAQVPALQTCRDPNNLCESERRKAGRVKMDSVLLPSCSAASSSPMLSSFLSSSLTLSMSTTVVFAFTSASGSSATFVFSFLTDVASVALPFFG